MSRKNLKIFRMKNKLSLVCIIFFSAFLLLSCGSKTLEGTWCQIRSIENANGDRTEITKNKIFQYIGRSIYDSIGTPIPFMDTSIQINEKDSTIHELKMMFLEGEKYVAATAFKENTYKFHLVNEDELILGRAKYYRISEDDVDNYIEGELKKRKQEEEEYKELKKSFSKQEYLYGIWEYSGNGVEAKYIINDNDKYSFYSNVGGLENGNWSGGPESITFQTEGGFVTARGSVTEDGELSVGNMVFTKN